MGNPGFNTLLQKNTREKTEESFDPLSSEDPELRYSKMKEKCVNLQASNTALKQKIQELQMQVMLGNKEKGELIWQWAEKAQWMKANYEKKIQYQLSEVYAKQLKGEIIKNLSQKLKEANAFISKVKQEAIRTRKSSTTTNTDWAGQTPSKSLNSESFQNSAAKTERTKVTTSLSWGQIDGNAEMAKEIISLWANLDRSWTKELIFNRQKNFSTSLERSPLSPRGLNSMMASPSAQTNREQFISNQKQKKVKQEYKSEVKPRSSRHSPKKKWVLSKQNIRMKSRANHNRLGFRSSLTRNS